MTTKLLKLLTFSFSNLKVVSSPPLCLYPSMPRRKPKPSSASRKDNNKKKNSRNYSRPSITSAKNCVNNKIKSDNIHQAPKRRRMDQIEEGVRRVTLSTIEGEVYSRDRGVPIQDLTVVPPKEHQGQVLRVKLSTEKPPSGRPKVIRGWSKHSDRQPKPQLPSQPRYQAPPNQGYGPRGPNPFFSRADYTQLPFNPNFARQYVPPQYAQQHYPPSFPSPSYFEGYGGSSQQFQNSSQVMWGGGYGRYPTHQHDKIYDMSYWNKHEYSAGRQQHRGFGNQAFVPSQISQLVATESRQWESTTATHSDNKKLSGGIRFRLMCYNVLSPTLQQMHQNIYDRCNPRALDWTARWATFCKEIEFCKPDIVCFQEIDAGFLEDYNEYFHNAGYQGVFKKRTGDKSDGCAIFYRDVKFRMIDHINVEYLQKSVSLLNRDNIALLVKLETKEETPRRIVVGTTHLLFNYKRNDVRVAQVKLLLAELDRIACYGLDAGGLPKYHATIVNGDFNVNPSNCVSQFFRFGNLSLKDTGIEDKLKNIPTRLGISDQCFHYKVHHQRLMKNQEHLVESPSHESTKHVYLSESNPRPNVLVKSELGNEIEMIDITQTINQKQPANENQQKENVYTRNQARGESVSHPHPSILSDITNKGSRCTFGTGELSHAFNFRDVYGSSNPGDEEHADDDRNFVSTCQSYKWVRVDYIYYSLKGSQTSQKREEGNLRLLRRLRLPTRGECRSFGGGIPCAGVSSDHFPLAAEFMLTSPE